MAHCQQRADLAGAPLHAKPEQQGDKDRGGCDQEHAESHEETGEVGRARGRIQADPLDGLQGKPEVRRIQTISEIGAEALRARIRGSP